MVRLSEISYFQGCTVVSSEIGSIERRDSSLCVVLLKNPVNFGTIFISYVPQHRTLKLQDTRQDTEQHHETSTQTRMTERHHGKKMAPVAPPTIERRRQLIVTATVQLKIS
ncbi:hypothetical protein AVEN_62123-1 [Araneus ventricosus]|uniref:Uncharacterized protein n=1 Tax=Araneus ventricosus TaxID=182803 RepID=A0A4Y2VHG8_ARAVE|nr:hypothetical protein AVEN_62123-1 [Araneus ventricosus]